MLQQQVESVATATMTAALETNLATLLCAQSHLFIMQAAYENGICAAQQAIALAQKHQRPELIARGRYLWGAGLTVSGDHLLAEQQLVEALTLARSMAMHELVVMVLTTLGGLAQSRSEYSRALSFCQEALALSSKEQYMTAQNRARLLLGSIYHRLGDFQQTKVYWEEVVVAIEKSGLQVNQKNLFINMGVLSDNLGNYAAAQRYYEGALRLCISTDDQPLQASILGNLGISADYVGDYRAALTYSQSCLQALRQVGATGRMPIVLVNLGLHSHHLGDQLAAQQYGQQALAISQQYGNRHLQSYAWTILGHAATALEEYATAKDAYTEAITLAQELAIPLMTIEPLAGLVRIGLARHTDPTMIQPDLEVLISFLAQQSIDGLEEPFRVYLTCYQGLQAMGDARSKPLLKTAYTLLQQRAAQIDERVMQRSFLGNVAAHRDLRIAAQNAKI